MSNNVDRILEEEYVDLINQAWDEYDAAIAENDLKMAEFWKEEALEMIDKLPKNTVCIRTIQ